MQVIPLRRTHRCDAKSSACQTLVCEGDGTSFPAGIWLVSGQGQEGIDDLDAPAILAPPAGFMPGPAGSLNLGADPVEFDPIFGVTIAPIHPTVEGLSRRLIFAHVQSQLVPALGADAHACFVSQFSYDPDRRALTVTIDV